MEDSVNLVSSEASHHICRPRNIAINEFEVWFFVKLHDIV